MLKILHACLMASLPLGIVHAAEKDRVELIRDRAHLRSEIRVASPQGKVAMGDFARGIARLNGFDDQELRGAIPNGKVSVSSRDFRWTMDRFNWVMQPCVRCDVVRRENQDPSVRMTVDREAARDWVNQCKAGFRSTIGFVDGRDANDHHGIKFLDAPDSDPTDLVVLIHGLNSRPEDLASLVPVVRRVGLVTTVFSYPNDQPIDRSSEQLSRALRKLSRQFPRRRVRLVTHSMGGLVARGALELPGLDPGNVKQLIMVAPPNHGSALANVALFMDCHEFFSSAERRRPSVLIDSVSDGLGEATADLEPNSVFLDKLNARPRHSGVKYTILLGTKAPMQPREMARLRDTVRGLSDGNRYLRFVCSKLNLSLDSLNEVVDGRGDGVVATWRGRLKGVEDVVRLPFSHAGVLQASHPSSQQAYRVIANRLQRG